jgi:hypothetical protein
MKSLVMALGNHLQDRQAGALIVSSNQYRETVSVEHVIGSVLTKLLTMRTLKAYLSGKNAIELVRDCGAGTMSTCFIPGSLENNENKLSPPGRGNTWQKLTKI